MQKVVGSNPISRLCWASPPCAHHALRRRQSRWPGSDRLASPPCGGTVAGPHDTREREGPDWLASVAEEW